jgi:hypothetical protein
MICQIVINCRFVSCKSIPKRLDDVHLFNMFEIKVYFIRIYVEISNKEKIQSLVKPYWR